LDDCNNTVKGIGSQQVLAGHKGTNSAHLVQSENAEQAKPVIPQSRRAPAHTFLWGGSVWVNEQCWAGVQMCLQPGRKGRSWYCW